jgi:hypothetical protein
MVLSDAKIQSNKRNCTDPLSTLDREICREDEDFSRTIFSQQKQKKKTTKNVNFRTSNLINYKEQQNTNLKNVNSKFNQRNFMGATSAEERLYRPLTPIGINCLPNDHSFVSIIGQQPKDSFINNKNRVAVLSESSTCLPCIAAVPQQHPSSSTKVYFAQAIGQGMATTIRKAYLNSQLQTQTKFKPPLSGLSSNIKGFRDNGERILEISSKPFSQQRKRARSSSGTQPRKFNRLSAENKEKITNQPNLFRRDLNGILNSAYNISKSHRINNQLTGSIKRRTQSVNYLYNKRQFDMRRLQNFKKPNAVGLESIKKSASFTTEDVQDIYMPKQLDYFERKLKSSMDMSDNSEQEEIKSRRERFKNESSDIDIELRSSQKHQPRSSKLSLSEPKRVKHEVSIELDRTPKVIINYLQSSLPIESQSYLKDQSLKLKNDYEKGNYYSSEGRNSLIQNTENGPLNNYQSSYQRQYQTNNSNTQCQQKSYIEEAKRKLDEMKLLKYQSSSNNSAQSYYYSLNSKLKSSVNNVMKASQDLARASELRQRFLSRNFSLHELYDIRRSLIRSNSNQLALNAGRSLNGINTNISYTSDDIDSVYMPWMMENYGRKLAIEALKRRGNMCDSVDSMKNQTTIRAPKSPAILSPIEQQSSNRIRAQFQQPEYLNKRNLHRPKQQQQAQSYVSQYYAQISDTKIIKRDDLWLIDKEIRRYMKKSRQQQQQQQQLQQHQSSVDSNTAMNIDTEVSITDSETNSDDTRPIVPDKLNKPDVSLKNKIMKTINKSLLSSEMTGIDLNMLKLDDHVRKTLRKIEKRALERDLDYDLIRSFSCSHLADLRKEDFKYINMRINRSNKLLKFNSYTTEDIIDLYKPRVLENYKLKIAIEKERKFSINQNRNLDLSNSILSKSISTQQTPMRIDSDVFNSPIRLSNDQLNVEYFLNPIIVSGEDLTLNRHLVTTSPPIQQIRSPNMTTRSFNSSSIASPLSPNAAFRGNPNNLFKEIIQEKLNEIDHKMAREISISSLSTKKFAYMPNRIQLKSINTIKRIEELSELAEDEENENMEDDDYDNEAVSTDRDQDDSLEISSSESDDLVMNEDEMKNFETEELNSLSMNPKLGSISNSIGGFIDNLKNKTPVPVRFKYITKKSGKTRLESTINKSLTLRNPGELICDFYISNMNYAMRYSVEYIQQVAKEIRRRRATHDNFYWNIEPLNSSQNSKLARSLSVDRLYAVRREHIRFANGADEFYTSKYTSFTTDDIQDIYMPSAIDNYKRKIAVELERRRRFAEYDQQLVYSQQRMFSPTNFDCTDNLPARMNNTDGSYMKHQSPQENILQSIILDELDISILRRAKISIHDDIIADQALMSYQPVIQLGESKKIEIFKRSIEYEDEVYSGNVQDQENNQLNKERSKLLSISSLVPAEENIEKLENLKISNEPLNKRHMNISKQLIAYEAMLKNPELDEQQIFVERARVNIENMLDEQTNYVLINKVNTLVNNEMQYSTSSSLSSSEDSSIESSIRSSDSLSNLNSDIFNVAEETQLKSPSFNHSVGVEKASQSIAQPTLLDYPSVIKSKIQLADTKYDQVESLEKAKLIKVTHPELEFNSTTTHPPLQQIDTNTLDKTNYTRIVNTRKYNEAESINREKLSKESIVVNETDFDYVKIHHPPVLTDTTDMTTIPIPASSLTKPQIIEEKFKLDKAKTLFEPKKIESPQLIIASHPPKIISKESFVEIEPIEVENVSVKKLKNPSYEQTNLAKVNINIVKPFGFGIEKQESDIYQRSKYFSPEVSMTYEAKYQTESNTKLSALDSVNMVNAFNLSISKEENTDLLETSAFSELPTEAIKNSQYITEDHTHKTLSSSIIYSYDSVGPLFTEEPHMRATKMKPHKMCLEEHKINQIEQYVCPDSIRNDEEVCLGEVKIKIKEYDQANLEFQAVPNLSRLAAVEQELPMHEQLNESIFQEFQNIVSYDKVMNHKQEAFKPMFTLTKSHEALIENLDSSTLRKIEEIVRTNEIAEEQSRKFELVHQDQKQIIERKTFLQEIQENQKLISNTNFMPQLTCLDTETKKTIFNAATEYLQGEEKTVLASTFQLDSVDKLDYANLTREDSITFNEIAHVLVPVDVKNAKQDEFSSEEEVSEIEISKQAIEKAQVEQVKQTKQELQASLTEISVFGVGTQYDLKQLETTSIEAIEKSKLKETKELNELVQSVDSTQNNIYSFGQSEINTTEINYAQPFVVKDYEKEQAVESTNIQLLHLNAKSIVAAVLNVAKQEAIRDSIEIDNLKEISLNNKEQHISAAERATEELYVNLRPSVFKIASLNLPINQIQTEDFRVVDEIEIKEKQDITQVIFLQSEISELTMSTNSNEPPLIMSRAKQKEMILNTETASTLLEQEFPKIECTENSIILNDENISLEPVIISKNMPLAIANANFENHVEDASLIQPEDNHTEKAISIYELKLEQKAKFQPSIILLNAPFTNSEKIELHTTLELSLLDSNNEEIATLNNENDVDLIAKSFSPTEILSVPKEQIEENEFLETVKPLDTIELDFQEQLSTSIIRPLELTEQLKIDNITKYNRSKEFQEKPMLEKCIELVDINQTTSKSECALMSVEQTDTYSINVNQPPLKLNVPKVYVEQIYEENTKLFEEIIEHETSNSIKVKDEVNPALLLNAKNPIENAFFALGKSY